MKRYELHKTKCVKCMYSYSNYCDHDGSCLDCEHTHSNGMCKCLAQATKSEVEKDSCFYYKEATK